MSGGGIRCFFFLVFLCWNRFIQHQDAMRGEIVIPGEGLASEKIVHGLVKVESNRRMLMIQKEIDLPIILLPHAHFHGVRHFQQGVKIAELTQPRD